jgi:hypothetical protein
MYEISKGYQLPSSTSQRGVPKFPFKDMDIGDSILVDKQSTPSARCSAYNYSKISGYKFISRADGKSTRFWRTE